MQSNTTHRRGLATAAALAFTGGGLTILLGDALLRPAEWTTYHVLTMLTVGGTIAAGHLMADAGRTSHITAAAGFLVLFLAGTGLVVYQSVGRQAEATDTSTLTAEATNAALAEKHADLRDAKARQRHANRKADEEMTGQRCLDRCKAWRTNAADIGAAIEKIEARIAALGPQKPVNAKAAKMADVAALFGADHAKAKAALMLLEPFLLTLFFELGSVVSLGYVFGGSLGGASVAHQQPRLSDVAKTSFAGLAPAELFADTDTESDTVSDTAPNRPNSRGGRDRGGPKRPDGQPNRPSDRPQPGPALSKDEVCAALVTDVSLGRTFGSQDEIAERFGRSKSTISDWLKEWEAAGLIPARRTVGRRKEIAR